MENKVILGGLNKITGKYYYPVKATKKDKYICVECNKDLILCQGEIRIPHFRHKIDTKNPCNYYDKPSETQIHKDAKLLFKDLLERQIPIIITRNCKSCNKVEEFEISEVTETSNIILEHRFDFNGTKIADVAYIDDNEITCIFEICNTHKTSNENRPEPWFEIDAKTLLKNVNESEFSSLKISCIRNEDCDECKKKKCHYASNKIRRYIYYKLSGLKECTIGCTIKCSDTYSQYYHPKGHPECELCHCRYLYEDLSFNAGDSDGYTHNKKILELFEDKFYGYHAIIQTYKGTGSVFIVSKKSYEKYDWVDDYRESNVDCYNLKLPYIKKIEVMSADDTINIIEDIIISCKELKTIKEEKIKDIKNMIKNIENQDKKWKNNIDSDDVADTYRSMRYANQYNKYKKSLEIELEFIEADVDYIENNNNIISIVHKKTNTKIRRSLVNNKTYFNKKWRTNISTRLIIKWYYSESDYYLE
jgi:hypothetical protein